MLSFHVKFVQTDRWMDGQTDGQTDRRTTVKQYAPELSIQGHKNGLVQGETILKSWEADTSEITPCTTSVCDKCL